jgi:DNA primase
MDAIGVWQAGVKNVVASCGTSLTEAQVRMLARFGSEVVVSYDPDSAGVAATDRSLALLLEEGMSVRILRLPGGSDPDQFIQEKGSAAYQSQLKDAQPFFRYLAGRALELHGKANPEAKLAGINFVLPFLAKVPNKLIRAELVADIAQKMDVSAGIILDSFRKAGLERREFLKAPSEINRVPSAEAMLIRLLLDNEKACRELGPLLEEKSVLQEFELSTIVETLVGMIQAGSVPDMASLADRLDESQQRVLAQIVFDKDARPVSIEEISTYIGSLERGRLQRLRLSLQRKILEAEKSGDPQKAVELLQGQAKLDKELGRLL